MPKITINDTIKIYFFKTVISILVISNHNSFRMLFDKIASAYFGGENIFTFLALEMASPGNQHYRHTFVSYDDDTGLTEPGAN